MEATKNVAVFYIIKEGINDKEAVRNVAVFIRNNGGASPALQLRQQDFPRVQKRILHTLQLSLFFIGFGGILGVQILDFLGGWGYFVE